MNTFIPPFRPLPWIRGGHAQTLAGFWMPTKKLPYTAEQHQIILPDGDCIVLHDDCPEDWKQGGPTALLLHGMCGSHRGSYMARAAGKLNERGVRVFRMDQRGCGAGKGLARRPYHAGSSNDSAWALRTIARLCPGSPTSLVGYSMGGNIVLKLAGEAPHLLPRNVANVIAISPPIDLAAAAGALNRPSNRFYNRYFVKYLRRIAACLGDGYRRLGMKPVPVPPFQTLDEFNEYFFTKVWNFESLPRFYDLCSSGQHLHAIRVPTLIVTAADDPIVPVESFNHARLSPTTRLVVTERGGHLGFVGAANPHDPDKRWMDWRVVDWVAGVPGRRASPAVESEMQLAGV